MESVAVTAHNFPCWLHDMKCAGDLWEFPCTTLTVQEHQEETAISLPQYCSIQIERTE